MQIAFTVTTGMARRHGKRTPAAVQGAWAGSGSGGGQRLRDRGHVARVPVALRLLAGIHARLIARCMRCRVHAIRHTFADTTRHTALL